MYPTINPVYVLVKEQPHLFTNAELRFEEKIAAKGNGAAYIMVHLYERGANPIVQGEIINGENYRVVQSHISVFEDFLSFDEAKKKRASFHWTAELRSSSGTVLSLHVYFRELGNLAFVQLKDGNDEVVSLPNNAWLGQFAKKYSEVFLQLLAQVYEQRCKRVDAAYVKCTAVLQEKSVGTLMETYQEAELSAYRQLVVNVIDVLTERNQVDFYQNQFLIKYFSRVLKITDRRLTELNATVAIEEIESSEEDEGVEEVRVEKPVATAPSPAAASESKEVRKSRKKLAEIEIKLAALDSEPEGVAKKVKRYLLLTEKSLLLSDINQLMSCYSEIS